jgi:hypothetical protein
MASHKNNRVRVQDNPSYAGSYARKKMLYIDFSNFAEYAERLETLGANLEEVFTKAMNKEAAKVQADTISALAKPNLPAEGIYSQGDTVNAVIKDVKTIWHGEIGEVQLGFDKTMPGAGGFLITGTPRMRPDYELEAIYGNKKYEERLKNSIKKDLQEEIDSIMGG